MYASRRRPIRRHRKLWRDKSRTRSPADGVMSRSLPEVCDTPYPHQIGCNTASAGQRSHWDLDGVLKPLLGKPLRPVMIPWCARVKEIIHQQCDPSGKRIARAQESDNVVIKSGRLGIGADSHADGTVGSGCAPVFIACLHLALPLDNPPNLLLAL